MKRGIGVSVAVACAAVALSACSGTGTLLPDYDAAPMPSTATTTDTTTTTVPTIPAPATSAHVAEPAVQWIPTVSMSPNTVMRGAVDDAWAFWTSDPKMPSLPPPSASPGDVMCGEGSAPDTSAASCGDGSIRWNTERLVSRAADVPTHLRPWTWTIIAAHETGHHLEGSILADRTYQERENIAECLAGVYIRHRFSTVASADDILAAYGALGRDARIPDNAVPEAFHEGLLIDRDTAPTAAFKTCARSWG